MCFTEAPFEFLSQKISPLFRTYKWKLIQHWSHGTNLRTCLSGIAAFSPCFLGSHTSQGVKKNPGVNYLITWLCRLPIIWSKVMLLSWLCACWLAASHQTHQHTFTDSRSQRFRMLRIYVTLGRAQLMSECSLVYLRRHPSNQGIIQEFEHHVKVLKKQACKCWKSKRQRAVQTTLDKKLPGDLIANVPRVNHL